MSSAPTPAPSPAPRRPVPKLKPWFTLRDVFRWMAMGVAFVIAVAIVFRVVMVVTSNNLVTGRSNAQSQERQWTTVRNDTFVLNPGGVMVYGPISQRSTRVEITTDHAVNIAFFPSSWKDQLVANPALIRANWNSAKCANPSVLQTSITCELDGESSLAIQDVRQPIDAGSVFSAAIAHKLTGGNTSA